MKNRDTPKELETELSKFRENNFSHNSAEEFLRMKKDDGDYVPVHLSVAYVPGATPQIRLYNTEIRLAQEAIGRGCKYVTNLDYSGPVLVGTGLRPAGQENR